MDMKLRKILRDFVNWQGKNNLLKNELTIDYELAETYLEEKEKAINFAYSSTKLPSIETLTFDEFLFIHFYKLKGDQYISKESNKTYDLKTITAEYDKWLNK